MPYLFLLLQEMYARFLSIPTPPDRRFYLGQNRTAAAEEAADYMRGIPMKLPEPSIDQWLKEAKASPSANQCGMFLAHNGIVRSTPKKQVREGIEGLGEVKHIEFSYDAEGVNAAIEEALSWPGVYYVKVWLNEGILEVGDSLMYVLIGADIRPHCIEALQNLVGKIKNDFVTEKEIYA